MSPLMRAYLFLSAAIALEVAATSLLNASEQFTRLCPTAGMIIGYILSFYCLSHALKTINIGVSYAIWSGCGIVLISIVGLVAFKQKLDLPAVIGLGMIVAGVVIINIFSKTVSH